MKDPRLLPASGDSTSTLESINADAVDAPAIEPLRVLRPSEVRARKRPRAIALVWLWELAFAALLATPVQAWAASVWANHPDGDAPIFRPGGQDLLGWLKYGGQPFSIVLRATLLALFFAALVAPLVTCLLGAQLATARGQRAPSTRSSLRLALGMYFPLLVVGALATALEVLVLGIGLLASSVVHHRLVEPLGDARAFLVRLVVLAIFLAVVLVVGVVGDLLRVAVVRAVAKEPDARALPVLRRAVPHAAATARRSLGRATFGWAWRALASTALVVVGSLLGDAVGGRGGLVLAALFVAHQLLVAGHAALRAGWLANALRLL